MRKVLVLDLSESPTLSFSPKTFSVTYSVPEQADPVSESIPVSELQAITYTKDGKSEIQIDIGKFPLAPRTEPRTPQHPRYAHPRQGNPDNWGKGVQFLTALKNGERNSDELAELLGIQCQYPRASVAQSSKTLIRRGLVEPFYTTIGATRDPIRAYRLTAKGKECLTTRTGGTVEVVEEVPQAN